MSEDLIKDWIKRFRSDSVSDGLHLLDDHMSRLSEAVGVPQGIPTLGEGTVQVVVACYAYLGLDHCDRSRTKRFLDLQRYSLWKQNGDGYIFTFDLHSKAYGSIRVEDSSRLGGYVDLAALYGHPWWEYERVGYDKLYITRLDWAEFTGPELELIESQVTEDIRWDYSEDELDMLTEISDEGNCFTVNLQGRYDEDD